MIRRRLEGGCPWLWTKRIGRGGGGTESDVFKLLMARTWWFFSKGAETGADADVGVDVDGPGARWSNGAQADNV